MKKSFLFFSILFSLFISIQTKAQSKTGGDYFTGKWNMLVKGTPGGDSKMIVSVEKKDSTMTGMILDSAGTEISKISKAELKETQLTVYFTAQGYDVYLVMDKKDEDHVTASLIGMFEADGERVKPSQNKVSGASSNILEISALSVNY